MVVLNVKRSEKESFLFEIPAATEVEVVRKELVKIHNLRSKTNRLTGAVEQLGRAMLVLPRRPRSAMTARRTSESSGAKP